MYSKRLDPSPSPTRLSPSPGLGPSRKLPRAASGSGLTVRPTTTKSDAGYHSMPFYFKPYSKVGTSERPWAALWPEPRCGTLSRRPERTWIIVNPASRARAPGPAGGSRSSRFLVISVKFRLAQATYASGPGEKSTYSCTYTCTSHQENGASMPRHVDMHFFTDFQMSTYRM